MVQRVSYEGLVRSDEGLIWSSECLMRVSRSLEAHHIRCVIGKYLLQW